MAEESYDVIIIGGGPAGLTSGIYTARHGLSTLIIEGGKLGGKSWGNHRIENYPGFPEGVTGTELMERFIAQTRRFGALFKEETVVNLMDLGEKKMVQTRGGLYESKAIVIATGIRKKQLSIPGEMEFKGRGVSYCAICDGPFFTGKTIAVVGSGNEAIEDALRLADVAEKVYAIPGAEGYDPEIEELRELHENDKIEVLEEAELESIGGENLVSHITLKRDVARRLDLDGVFIILESVPTTDLLQGASVEADGGGCIVVDKNQSTNVEGIFAAGDCVCGGMQVVTAAGDGGKAGLFALRYVRSQRK